MIYLSGKLPDKVHGGIRHLEMMNMQNIMQYNVHGGIRHLEK